MKAFLSCFMLSVCIAANAGPHTLQKGESFADVAQLYNISLDTLLKVNKNVVECTGMTIEIPLNTLVYDLGESGLFRKMRFDNKSNTTKGRDKFSLAFEKQMKITQYNENKRVKEDAKITEAYNEAIYYGNTSALYQLGRRCLHGGYYSNNDYPNFGQSLNPNLEEFRRGIELLQIAVILGNDKKALAELAIACGSKQSPIYNPYLCLSILQQNTPIFGKEVNNLICYMYEKGYGISRDLLQAYVYCPSTELINGNGAKTHREMILESIDTMHVNFESAKYGVGLKSDMLMSIAFSRHYQNKKMDAEGIFFLHRAAKMDNADAYWTLAGILENDNCKEDAMGSPSEKKSQVISMIRKSASLGKQEAKDYLEKYNKYLKEKAEYERQLAEERKRKEEERKRRKRQKWAQIGIAVLQTAAKVYTQVETAKQQSRMQSDFSKPSMQTSQMSMSQYMARNQLALQQIAQYTYNQSIADWNGTPMMPTNMSAVNLGTDTRPGSPLWMWGQQQQINTMATQNTRMQCEILAFYKRQADQITQQLMTNPTQPIAGYVDRDGNWISREMVAAGIGSGSENETKTNVYEEIREKNRNYFKERYGYKDCPQCHRSGICSTCNGKSYNHNGWGEEGIHQCPNCWKENGRSTGKCGKCQGSGQVYGLR